jgi:hypothetical protein
MTPVKVYVRNELYIAIDAKNNAFSRAKTSEWTHAGVLTQAENALKTESSLMFRGKLYVRIYRYTAARLPTAEMEASK